MHIRKHLKFFGYIFIALALFFSSTLFANTLTAEVDRASVAVGDSFTLTLTTEDINIAGNPNLSTLLSDFQVLGSGRSNELSIINDKATSETRWSFMLSPKHAGTLTIPALQVGSLRSQELSIQATPAGTASLGSSASTTTSTATATATATNTNQNTTNSTGNGQVAVTTTDPDTQPTKGTPRLLLESSLSPKAAYPRQQVVYTVRLLTQDAIQGGTLTDPSPSNATVLRLGEDVNYQTTQKGRHYVAVERHYAVFPQTSDPVNIASLVFNGQVFQTQYNTAGLPDVFGGRLRPAQAKSPSVTLSIRAKPADADPNQTWLPAERLVLTENWSSLPQNNNLRVGEPITRTLTMTATGLTGEQLPAPQDAALLNVSVYPSQPLIKTATSAQGVVGERTDKIAFVPKQAGALTFPAIHVRWWNIKQENWEDAVLPARTLTVLPALGTSTSTRQTTSTTSGGATPATEIGKTKATAPNNILIKSSSSKPILYLRQFKQFVRKNWPWWVASGLLIAWILTLLAWWRQKRRVRAILAGKTTAISLTRSKQAVKLAATLQEAKTALLTWAAIAWPEESISTLGELSKHCSPALKEIVQTLDQALYANFYDLPAPTWDAAAFWSAFQLHTQATVAAERAHHETDENPLPPLYPKRD